MTDLQNLFLLHPGTWLGEGKIQFSTAELNELKYYTRWKISIGPEGAINATQEIELIGGSDKSINLFQFTKIQGDRFDVLLENELFGKVQGKGLFSADSIAWEFHGPGLEFEGFEVFQRQKDNTYITRAEYSSFNEPHTIITGTLWKKG